MDIFIEKLIDSFNKGKRRQTSLEYAKTQGLMSRAKCEIEKLKSKGEEYHHLVKQVKELRKQNRTIPSIKTNDPNYKRLWYCRYADDFVLGVIGSKEDAKKIKKEIEIFIFEKLKLEISEEKTGISYSKDGTEFLGYEIRSYSCNRIIRTRAQGCFVIKRSIREQMQLHIPRRKLYDFIRKNRFGNLDTMKPNQRNDLVNHTDYEIISRYNWVMRGFANYYSLAKCAKSVLNKPMYVARCSLIGTLALKHNCSAKKVITHILNGKNMTHKYEHKGKVKYLDVFKPSQLNTSMTGTRNIDKIPAWYKTVAHRSELLSRILADKCEYCLKEKGYFEVHHVRKLADIKGKSTIDKIMIARRRKTLVLCVECHDLLHAGKLPDKRFKKIYA